MSNLNQVNSFFLFDKFSDIRLWNIDLVELHDTSGVDHVYLYCEDSFALNFTHAR